MRAGIEQNGHTEGTQSGAQSGAQPGEQTAGRPSTSRYRERAIDGAFACAWTHTVGEERAPSRILPDNCADFIVSSTGGSWLVGPATAADLMLLAPGVTLRGLRMRPGWLGALLRVPADELTDRTVAISDVLGSARARRLIELIAGDATDHRRLHDIWPDPTPVDLVLRAVRELTTRPDLGATALAAQSFLSPRHLRRMVVNETGLNPKTLQKVGRLHRFLGAARSRRTSLGAAAAAAGYADQSHLTRDVRQLTGTTPARLLAERAGRIQVGAR